MFCCTRKQTHEGQIVTTLCQEADCIKGNNQLSCTLCAQQDHQGHNLTSLRKIIPCLLEAEREKEELKGKLGNLLQFVCSQFGEVNEEGQSTDLNNIVQRTHALLISLKSQVDINSEEMSKMKSIFKNLNKTAQNQSFYKSVSKNEEEHILIADSPQKAINPSSILIKGNPSTSKSKVIGSQIQQLGSSPEIDCFSHSAKHPYLSISPNFHTVTKVSHSGHRFAALGAKCLSEKQSQLRIRIDKSISGNIMVGLCHESVVRDKQFCNSYGIGTGTYLIGQNGSNPTTAISFHHSVAIMNRKEIVGWNFQETDIIVIGINFQQNFIFFRREGKKTEQEFVMKINGIETKSQLRALINEGFKLIVLLQSQGDQVSIVEQQ